jgi:hypothetical protein
MSEDRVFKYAKLLRKTDEGVKALFSDLVVVTEEGDAHKVPCLWATHEKLAAFVEQSNPTSELDLNGKRKIVKDSIKLPVIGVYSNDITMSGSQPLVAYHVNIWTLFQEDMNQILEQIILKFDNKKNCKLVGISRNYNEDNSGEEFSVRVLKSSLGLTVEGIGVPVETHE